MKLKSVTKLLVKLMINNNIMTEKFYMEIKHPRC